MKMLGDVVAFELDRYLGFLLFEQRAKVLHSSKQKKNNKGEQKGRPDCFLGWWEVEK